MSIPSGVLGVQFTDGLGTLTLDGDILLNSDGSVVLGPYPADLSGGEALSGTNFLGGGLMSADAPSCLLSDSLILMSDSTYKKIIDIKQGDFVVGAKSKANKKVLQVIRREVELEKESTNIVFKIESKSLDGSLPKQDILISGNHHILLKNISNSEKSFVLMPARLLPSSTIFLNTGIVSYFHLQVEDDDGFFVSDLAVESFRS